MTSKANGGPNKTCRSEDRNGSRPHHRSLWELRVLAFMVCDLL